MSKKLILILSFLSSVTLNYSMSGELNTNGNIDFNLKSNEKEKTFSFDKASYNLTLLDLKLKDNNYGFNFGTVIKSSRNNILLNDYGNEKLHKEDKSLDHDLQAKFFVDYDKKFDKFNIKTGINYYLENFLIYKIRDENGNIITDNRANFEYVDGDKKYIGGDVNLNFAIGYNVTDTMKFDFFTEYYANKFIDFKTGFPYFKFSTGLKDNEYEINYNFNLNLRSLFNPYVEEKENEDDENYAFLDNYVTRYRQQLDAKYENNGLKTGLELKEHGYIIGGTDKKDQVQIYNHRIFLNTNLSKENKVGNFTFNNSFNTENKFETVKYENTQKYELWSLLQPEYEFSVKYDTKIHDFNISPNAKYNVSLILPLTKDIFDINYLVNKHKLELNLETKYQHDNFGAKLQLDNNATMTMIKDKFANVEANFNQKLETKYTKDKLKLSSIFSNQTYLKTINDVQQRMYLDKSTNKNELSVKVNYDILPNLSFENETSAKYLVENNHILNGGNIEYVPFKEILNKDTDSEPTNDKIKKEFNYDKLYGREFTVDKNRILFIQKYLNTSNIEYKKNFDKLELTSNLKLLMELDTIALTKEKAAKERNQGEDLEEMRIPLLTSTPEKINTNIGGKIELDPSTKLKYNFNDNLNLELKTALSILFEKKVINQINDSKRTDNGLYGPQDKEFKLRKITPSFNISLNYVW